MSTTTALPTPAFAVTPSGRAAGRPWIGFAVVVGAAAMDLLDSTIAQTAAPNIRRAFGASYADLEWISAAYTLAMAALMILGSRLGDILGRRRVLLVAIGAFVVSSSLCALAPSAAALIAARALQGACAALMVPQGLTAPKLAKQRKNGRDRFVRARPFGVTARRSVAQGGGLRTGRDWADAYWSWGWGKLHVCAW